MRNIIKEAFIFVHMAFFITSYCVSYDFTLLFINNSNPYIIYAGNTRITCIIIMRYLMLSKKS